MSFLVLSLLFITSKNWSNLFIFSKSKDFIDLFVSLSFICFDSYFFPLTWCLTCFFFFASLKYCKMIYSLCPCCFVSNSNLSFSISIATPDFSWIPFAWNILFCPFTCRSYMSWEMNVFLINHIVDLGLGLCGLLNLVSHTVFYLECLIYLYSTSLFIGEDLMQPM